MTPALDSIHERILQAVKTEVDGLSLEGINAVYAKAFPEETEHQYPCVLVTLEGGTEEEGENSTFCDDHVVYPVNVMIADTASSHTDELRAKYLGWRRALMRHCRGLTELTNVPESWNVRVKGDLVVDPKQPQYLYVVSGFVVMVDTLEARKSVRS